MHCKHTHTVTYVDFEEALVTNHSLRVTYTEEYELLIRMRDVNGAYAEAHYGKFQIIGSREDGYKAVVEGFSRPNVYGLEDDLGWSGDVVFSARDVDKAGGSCQEYENYGAAGW